jgi:UDP-3-O-[3-hydroxymyristoyl] glucosamine N-acyltransferase
MMHRFPGGARRAGALAEQLGAVLHGPDCTVVGVAPAEPGTPDCVSFLDKERPTAAPLVLARQHRDGRSTLVVADPRRAFAALLRAHFGDQVWPGHVGVHPAATVDESAVLEEEVVVHAGARIGPGCRIGARTVIFPNAVLCAGTVVGADCRIHAGAVLGADGFSYVAGETGPERMPQLGRVRLGDRVDIGAGACVDRAALGETVLEDDVKVDNLVQIGHNVKIGRGTVIAAQSGLAGSATVGQGALLGGQVGVGDHVRIGDGAQVGAQAGVTGHVAAGAKVWGTPAMALGVAKRAAVMLRRMGRKKAGQ